MWGWGDNIGHKKHSNNDTTTFPGSPDVVCFSFSFFFFLHFQGLKILPRVASLLFLLAGGVRIPETRYSERTGGVGSISSVREHRGGSGVTSPT